jgi:hypothetical protein
MSIVTVRVDKKMKRRMSEKRDVNWSDVVRKAIAKKIDGEDERNLAVAVLLNEKNVMTPDSGYDSTKAIREWRKSIRWQ